MNKEDKAFALSDNDLEQVIGGIGTKQLDGGFSMHCAEDCGGSDVLVCHYAACPHKYK